MVPLKKNPDAFVELDAGLSSIVQPYDVWVNITLQKQMKGSSTWQYVISQLIDVPADDSDHVYATEGSSIQSGMCLVIWCWCSVVFCSVKSSDT